jgi:hypothetical protein
MDRGERCVKKQIAGRIIVTMPMTQMADYHFAVSPMKSTLVRAAARSSEGNSL